VLASVAPQLGRAAARYRIALMLMLTWGASVAVGIPVGSPPNLIAIGMLRQLGGQELTLLDWVAVAMPLTVIMLVLSWLILVWRYVPALHPVPGIEAAPAARAGAGAWRRQEKIVTAVFLAVCALWAWPRTARHEWLVALAAAAALTLVPIRRAPWTPTLSWRRAMHIDWGTLVLFGGGIALGRMLFDSGLAEAMGRALVRAAGVEGVWGLTAVAIVTGLILSEAASNTASASVAVPVMIAVALAAGVSPVPPALGAALGASFGFMLPVSTPPNAIVFGSGAVPLREMIRSGLLLDLLGAAAIWLGLRILCPIAGLG
jgi:sodium-dependent dicarboxylate transporter 2/3/5